MPVEITNGIQRWPPTTCDMPDLSGFFAGNSLDYALNRAIRGGGPKDLKAHALTMNFVRLVDHLIVCYENARRLFLEYLAQSQVSLAHVLRLTCDMEECVHLAVRAVRFARRMRNHRAAPEVGKLRILADSVFSRLNNMRNAMEHWEERILDRKRTMAEGDPVCLMVKNDVIELLGQEISYKDLAAWITELHKLAGDVAQYQERPNGRGV